MLGVFRFFYDTRRYRFRLFRTKADPKTTGGERADVLRSRRGLSDRTPLVSFRGEPNLILASPLFRNRQDGAALTWDVTAPVVEILADSSHGRKVCGGGSSGVVNTGPLERTTIFYLQDASRGNPRDPDKTLARVKIEVRAPRPVTFTADPNPAHVSDGSGSAVVTLHWTAPDTNVVAIRVNSPDGPLLATGGPCETLATDQWVTNGMVFFLQDISHSDAPDRRITIGQLEVGVIDPVHAELVHEREEGAGTADLQAVSSPLFPEGPVRYGVKRVAVTFSPERVLAGKPYRVNVPGFAGQVIDVGYELTGEQFSTPVIGIVNKWCELDLRGEALIVTPADHPEGIVRITRVRSQISNGAWHQAAGEIRVTRSR